MVKSKEAIKGKLMKEAEAVIDELLAWELVTEKPNLSQVEKKVQELRERLSKEMARTVISNQPSVQSVPGPNCTKCDTEMRYKGQKKNTVLSWVGELELERGYYYCAQCKTGLFPPGSTT